MESLTKPVTLSPDVDRVLGEIRAGAENALYGAGPDETEELFAKHVVSLIEGAGLPSLQTMHYRWFLRELARLWRTRNGRDLAFHLELCIRKWVGLGLESRTLQFLVCESYERLKTQSLATKTRNHEEVQPEPVNPSSVRQGPLGPTPEPQCFTTKTPSHKADRPEPQDPGTLPVDLSLPGIMAGPRPPARGPEDSTTKTQRHKGPGPDSSADAGSDHSIPSASTTKTPSHQGGDMTETGSEVSDRVPSPEEKTAKDAKIAKSDPDPDPRTLEPVLCPTGAAEANPRVSS